MNKGDKLVFLRSLGDPATSDHTRLAVALRCLGILSDDECPFARTAEMIDGQLVQVSVWAFHSRSKCGRFKTAEMIEAWNDPTWRQRNPEHPLAYLQTALRCLDTTRGEIDLAGRLMVIRRGERTGLIHETATPEEAAPVLARLNA